MSKDTGLDARDIEWNNKGYGKDIEFYKNKDRNNQSSQKLSGNQPI